MAQGQRIILLFLALIVISFNSISSRIDPDRTINPVTITNSSSTLLIRLKGEGIESGVYEVPVGSTVASVLCNRLRQSGNGVLDARFLRTLLKSGDVLSVAGGGRPVEITRMRANEQIVLGIPLDPDRMDLEDWSSVPGIGPRMARRIIDDRRAYGSFRSIRGILRVPGIGIGKFTALTRFF